MIKLKTGDNVKVIAGKEKGKEGKVAQVFPALNKVVVEGLNIAYKQLKAQGGNKGQKIEFSAPMNISNVQLVCPKCKKAMRLKYKMLKQEGKKDQKVRTCSKCNETI